MLFHPDLPKDQKQALINAINLTLEGKRVFVWLDYEKEDKKTSKSSKPNPPHLPIPNLPDSIHFGFVRHPHLSKDGDLFFSLEDYARGKMDALWELRHLRPERIRGLQLRFISALRDHRE